MSKHNFAEVMAELEAMGTEQNRKVYRRHGAGENLFGVSFANLNKLRKQIKRDHPLALQLWDSKNIDARCLATMIADPAQMSESDIDRWLRDISYYPLADLFVRHLVIKSQLAAAKMEQWTQQDDEWLGRAGWTLLALMAMAANDLPDAYFEKYLGIIEQSIHQCKNRTREAMNNALIAIGIRNQALRQQALAVAASIGPVAVDHGDTACQTPDAVSYIQKTWQRKQKQG